MDPVTAIEKIKTKIAEIKTLGSKERFCPEYKKWHRETSVLLQRIFGSNAYQISDFTDIEFVYHGIHMLGDEAPFERRYRDALNEATAILTSIHEEIEEFGLDAGNAASGNPLIEIGNRSRESGRSGLRVTSFSVCSGWAVGAWSILCL